MIGWGKSGLQRQRLQSTFSPLIFFLYKKNIGQKQWKQGGRELGKGEKNKTIIHDLDVQSLDCGS